MGDRVDVINDKVSTATVDPAVPDAAPAIATAASAGGIAASAVEAEAAAVAKPATVEAVVEAWVAKHIHNSPISRVVECWNHFHDAIGHLISDLKEL